VKIPLRRPARPPAKVRARAAEAEMEDYEAEAEPNMRFSHALFVVLVLHVIAVAGVFAFNSIKARETRKTAEAPPAPAATPPPQVASTPAKPSPPPGVVTHTIASGDTLGKIAMKYATSVAAIEEANRISATSLLRIGQVLTIPGRGAPPPKAAPTPKKPAIATVVASAKPAKPAATPANPEHAGDPVWLAAARTEPQPRPQASPQPAQQAPATAVAEPAWLDAAKAAATPAPAAPASSPASAGGGAQGKVQDGVYVVAKGDNPYSIARQLGVSYRKLLELNGIEDPTRIQIGQKLKVPSPD
jgi:LysM repeat protein